LIVRLRSQRLELACNHTAGGAIQRNPVAGFVGVALDAEFLGVFVDDAITGAGHAALAHAARNDCSVGRHAAA
jgi:hypothetical protein